MSVYSHSRLSCYEQCPQKYKLKYLDKVETEVIQIQLISKQTLYSNIIKKLKTKYQKGKDLI